MLSATLWLGSPVYRRFAISAAGTSHLGCVRDHNEDVVLMRDDLQLYAVADGAGGHNAGEVAAALACRSISNYIGATVKQAWARPMLDSFGVHYNARRLAGAVRKANQDVFQIAHSSAEYRNMVTTVVTALFCPRHGVAHVAHLGDSRCYRLRGRSLELLTTDHSLLMELLEREPDVDDRILARMPRNIVTRLLGLEEHPRISFRTVDVAPGDRFLLCSDGLSGMVDPSDLEAALHDPSPPQDTARALIDLALAGGGRDNVSVVIVDILAEESHERGAEPPAGVSRPHRLDEPPPDVEVVETDPGFDDDLLDRIERMDDLSPRVKETIQDVIKGKG